MEKEAADKDYFMTSQCKASVLGLKNDLWRVLAGYAMNSRNQTALWNELEALMKDFMT